MNDYLVLCTDAEEEAPVAVIVDASRSLLTTVAEARAALLDAGVSPRDDAPILLVAAREAEGYRGVCLIAWGADSAGTFDERTPRALEDAEARALLAALGRRPASYDLTFSTDAIHARRRHGEPR